MLAPIHIQSKLGLTYKTTTLIGIKVCGIRDCKNQENCHSSKVISNKLVAYCEQIKTDALLL